MSGYRDSEGKYTEVRFYVEDIHSDVIGIIDRSTDGIAASCWSNNRDLAERIATLLNERGLVDGLILDK